MKVPAIVYKEVAAQNNMESFVHTYEGFPIEPNDLTLIIRHVDLVAFILWHEEV